jgi:hypothetical protein
MLLVRISPDRLGYEQRIYGFRWCPHEMTEVSCVNELAALKIENPCRRGSPSSLIQKVLAASTHRTA